MDADSTARLHARAHLHLLSLSSPYSLSIIELTTCLLSVKDVALPQLLEEIGGRHYLHFVERAGLCIQRYDD